MKNRKGFTLVEIIVSLVLILLVSGVIIAMVFNNKKEKEEKIVEVTKKIQEAAGVYLSINKDIDDSIEQNIIKGGTGYVMPLQSLLDEGYIGENHIKTLEENIEGFDISKHYMLAAAFSNDPKCDNDYSTITIEASYALKNSTNYYLCNFTTKKLYTFYNLDGGYFTDDTEQVQMFIKGSSITLKDGSHGIVTKDNVSNIKYEFNGWYKQKDCGGGKFTTLNNLNNNVVYACYKETIKEDPGLTESPIINHILKNNKLKIKPLITKDSCEEGLFAGEDNDGITIFFRGDVNNNFIKYGKDKIGNDLIWRIVRVNGDGSLRIILNENVKYSLLDVNNNVIAIEDNDDSVVRIYPNHRFNSILTEYGTIFYNLTTTLSSNNKRYNKYDAILSKNGDYSFTISFGNGKNITINDSNILENYNSVLSLYDELMTYWIENVITLDNKLFKDGQFCSSSYRSHNIGTRTYNYVPNTNFKCDNNISGSSYLEYSNENKLVTKKIDNLSYGEYLMGTNISESCNLDEGFLSLDQPYILSNPAKIKNMSTAEYYFSDNTTRTLSIYYAGESDDGREVYYDSTLTQKYLTNLSKSSIVLSNFRPVINLKSNINITGEGTETNPYVIIS